MLEVFTRILNQWRLPQAEREVDSLVLRRASVFDITKAVERVAHLAEQVLGENSPRTAWWLWRLGGWYREIGNPEAYSCLQRSLEITRRVYDILHPRVAVVLNDLAGVCRLLGRVDEAEQCYRDALSIDKFVYGPRHPETLTDMNNLALLLWYRSDQTRNNDQKRIYRDEAGGLLKDISQTDLELYGPHHHIVAQDHLNWGTTVLIDKGDWSGAECEVRQALWIYETFYPNRTIQIAGTLGALAAVLDAQGDISRREVLELKQRAVAIDERELGPNHPDVGVDLYDLAVFTARRGSVQEALNLMNRACQIDDQIIGRVFSIGPESQRLIYIQQCKKRFNLFLSLVLQYFSGSSTGIRAALDLVLRRKAITAEAMAVQRDAVLGGKYPRLEPQFRELAALRMRIVQKTLAGPGAEDLQTHQQSLTQWNTQKERLETELAHQIPEMNVEQKLRAVNRQAVVLALPEAIALVEFARFNVFDFNAVPARDEAQWKSASYLAFVSHSGEPDNLQMIDLGEAEPIDQMIATFRSAITAEDEGRGLGALPGKPVGESDSSDGTKLRKGVFDKLLPAIGNRKRLLLAPDGDLTRLPFEALPTDDGRRLIDDYQISYLGVGRDALRFGAASSGQPTAALVAADPDFDLSGGQAHSPATSETIGVLRRGRVSRETQTADLEKLGPLPGTRVEGERVASMLGVKPLLGEEALEARIKACRSPRILHLATHGFFLADQQRDPNQELRGLGLLGGQAGDGFGPMSGRMSGPGMENPLLRSGVLLAGFKTWLKGGSLPAEAEDGLLTAEDVSGLDLLATELVVLSACETGLGEVRTGEGVFGLRRAFVLAGAKTLVMSLWKVPDEQTQELMEDFYRRILAGEPRAEALRQAQLEMKKKYPDPFYWGAFICQGDPGPLPA